MGGKKNILEICDSKASYYSLRLVLAEDRVFSNNEKYARAKISTLADDSVLTTVHNVHSVIGSIR